MSAAFEAASNGSRTAAGVGKLAAFCGGSYGLAVTAAMASE